MTEELKRIAVDNTTPAPQPMKAKKRFSPAYILVPLVVLLVLLGGIGVMLLPLRGVIAKGKEVAAVGRQTASALKNQDLAGTKDGLAKTRKSFNELSTEYNKIKPHSLS